MIRLVLDVACNRVIYYTSDRNARLVTNQHVYIREWFEALPMGMTHENCWDWKLVGDKLLLEVNTPTTYPKTLIEHNKERMLKFLIERVNEHRRPYDPSCHHSDWVRTIKLAEAKDGGGPLLSAMATELGYSLQEMCEEILFKDRQYKKVLIDTEIFKETYKEKISIAVNNEELYQFRDEIAAWSPGKPVKEHTLIIEVDKTETNSTLLVK